MNLQINANLTVWLQAISIFYDGQKVYVQWQAMKQNDSNVWELDAAKPTAQTALVTEKEGFTPFLALAETDKQTACANAIQNQIAA